MRAEEGEPGNEATPPCVHSLETPEECGTFGCEIRPGTVAAILTCVVVIALLVVSGWLLRLRVSVSPN